MKSNEQQLQNLKLLTLLGTKPNIDLWYNCNFYKMWYERPADGNIRGAYGYIEQCTGGCDTSKTEKVSQCINGSPGGENCNDKCRNNSSPFPSRHTDAFCSGTAAICKRLLNDFDAVKENRQYDCCSYNDLGVLMSKDCPPGLYEGSEGCAEYLSDFCKIGDNIKDIRCDQLKKIKPDLWKNIAQTYCINDNLNGERFFLPICQTFCQENRSTCEPLLTGICHDKTPADQKWNRVCGCHFKDEIFTTFSDSLDEKWSAPPGTFRGQRPCFFPECKSAYEGYQPLLIDKCPAVSVTSCLQQVTVDARGAVINDSDIIINQNVKECKSLIVRKDSSSVDQKCSTNKDCPVGGGYLCTNGTCQHTSTIKCKIDSDCSSTEEEKCIEGSCIKKAKTKDDDKTKKFPIWAILLIVFGGIIIFGGIIFGISKSMKKPLSLSKPISQIPVLSSIPEFSTAYHSI